MRHNIVIQTELKTKLDLLISRKGETYNEIIERIYTFHKILTEDKKSRIMACPKCNKPLVLECNENNNIRCPSCDEDFRREELEEYSYVFKERAKCNGIGKIKSSSISGG